MQRAVGYVEVGGAKIKNALAKQDMMEVEAGYKLVEFGKDKQKLQAKCQESWMKGTKLKESYLSLKEPKSQIVVVEHLTAIIYCYALL